MASVDLQGSKATLKSRSKNTAFIIEALFLLVFLIASLAIIVQLFTGSVDKATRSLHLERAVIAASNTAEQFSADPTGVPAQSEANGLIIKCDITPKTMQAGTLYNATITVLDDGEEVYSIQTARYESGVGR